MAPAQAAIKVALRRLSAGDRALLELSLRRGVPDDELATLLGLAPEEIRSRRERLLERLAVDVGTDGPAGTEDLGTALRTQDADVWALDGKGEDASTAEDRAPGPRERIAGWARSAPATALLLLPGGLTAYLGFNAGGFFPGDTAVATVVVCLVLVLHVTLAGRPAAGLGLTGGLATGLLGAFAVWTLLSGAWSDAAGRALIEFDRVLLYVLACGLFATLPRTTRSLQVMLWGFAGAAVIVCLVGLASRVLPELVPSAPSVSNERLAYPVTYWNALGMLAALGLLACFHTAAAERHPRVARVLGAAAVPGLAVTLYFTFSRGAIAVLAIALLVYALLGRPRRLLSAVLATVPPSVVALVVAYGAEMLARQNPTAPSAAGQANRVALVTAVAIAAAALLRFALAPLDARLSAVGAALGTRRPLLAGSGAVIVLVLAGASLALDAPAKLERHYDRFVEGGEVETGGDARRRLTDPANNGRLDHWRVALDVSREDRLKGQGAGTYEIAWARERPVQFTVLDAHSLYLEVLAELGIVGLALLGGALLLILAGGARRIRGPDRALYAAIFAMGLAWLIRAGADWDWEMPAITLW
ncbi:MAG: O-antigen ligase family protein, partial [Actinomycetota bacterium]|nr:O-antigen ligase family protein [Actinomycetota bacterium]